MRIFNYILRKLGRNYLLDEEHILRLSVEETTKGQPGFEIFDQPYIAKVADIKPPMSCGSCHGGSPSK